jgi:hypothetical protein
VEEGHEEESILMRRTGHIAHMGDRRNAFRVLVGKQGGKRPAGRPRCKWM